MASDDDQDQVDEQELEKAETVLRIADLRRRLAEVAGQEPVIHKSEDFPLEAHENFLNDVLAYEEFFENISSTTIRERIQKGCGRSFPNITVLRDLNAVQSELVTLIEALARVRIFLHNTNHLDDIALYRLLTEDILNQAIEDEPEDVGMNTHIDICACCEDDAEAMMVYLAYHAEEDERADYQQHFPDVELPSKQPGMSDRDAFLPKPSASYEADSESEDVPDEDR
jgi:hypothetical protein